MLHQLLQRSLTAEPNRQVIEFYGHFWTAVELENSACQLAGNLIQSGTEASDRVAVLLPNCPQTVLAYLACFKANFVIVPLDYRHQTPQIAYALNHSGASVLIVHQDRVHELDQAGVLASLQHVLVVGDNPARGRQRNFDEFLSQKSSAALPEQFSGSDLCVMIYTSGTTSRPKGVTLTRNAIEAGIKKYRARVPLGIEDTTLIAAPITRPMALRSQLLPTLHAGGCVSLLERFTVEGYLEALRRPPAKTFLAFLPTALAQLLAHPEIRQIDFSSLRVCMAGGDRVPQPLHQACEQITGVSLTEQCGASEVGFYALNPPFGRKKPGSIGLPMYDTQVCVVNEQGDDLRTNEIGEILVSSPMMMEGYWNDTALTRKTIQAGRIHTGDLGRFDEDGYLWFMGRKKDTIIRGGSNIAPLEVESVLLNHPAVADACVLGVLDHHWGQRVYACVVLQPGQAVSSEELLKYASSQLAEYMLPETIEFMEELPMKGPGKIDRDLLKMRAEIRPLIQQVPFFQHASDDFIRDFVPRLECKEFGARTIIFRQGDVGHTMYFLTRGRVEVVLEDSGKQLRILSPGAYFGEVAVLREVPRSASIRVIEDCEVYELTRASVVALIQSYSDFGQHVQQSLASYNL